MSSVELYCCRFCYVFRQQFGYFFFAKCVKCSAILYCSTKTTQTLPRASRLPFLLRRLLCTIEVTFLDIANIFQIWSTRASYEEITVGFGPIGNLEITSPNRCIIMNNYWMRLFVISRIKVLVRLISYTYQDLIDNFGYYKNRNQYLFYQHIHTQ